MAGHAIEDISGVRHQALRQSRREREFYRYYESLKKLSAEDPTFCDLNDGAAVRAHKPRSSPDKALTAFCQLGALRLNAKRAMTFFFDNNAGYVLAESTRTLSLEDDSVHSIGDELWLGYSVIPRGCSVCEYTVDLPSVGPPKSKSVGNIINDLLKDVRFSARSFVVEKPNARFYAGVPITTASGVNIGAYCILDDKPRDGLDELSMAFLHDMAATIMSHLESIRATAERKRATQMVDGLGAFVRNTSQPQVIDSWHTSNNTIVDMDDSSQSNIQASTTKATSRQRTGRTPYKRKLRSTPKRSSTEPIVPIASRQAPTAVPPHTKSASTAVDGSSGKGVVPDTQIMFRRAAELVREATDMDAVMFLDTSVGYEGGLLRRRNEPGESQRNFDCEPEEAEFSYNSRRPSLTWQTPGAHSDTPQCAILGMSHTPASDHAEATRRDGLDTTPINHSLALSLLQEYPKGKCWNFDEAGNTLSTGDFVNESLEDLTDDSNSRRASASEETYDYGDRIQRLYPGIRSFAIVGMWDQEQSRWFAACAVWSFEPLRILSDDYEVNFIAAFGEVVMAEVYRLRLQISTNSKIDFISSISHELRSPLHGILGSAECLQEQERHQKERDEPTKELIDQIDICGRTLLDIIDHLLDFSNINHYAPKTSRQAAENDNKLQKITSTPERMLSLGGTVSLDSDLSLDVVTEETIGAAVYSYCSSKASNVILSRKISIICDIESRPGLRWMCNIPTGSWKRLCINLVNNALKFTSEGHIDISLRATATSDPLKAFNAVLEVSDSGCGMSPEFLDNHLFEAFVQEDGLKEGTGLGMSLVAKIVKAFGGTIEVQSEKDVGTAVTVVVPVNHPHDAASVTTIGAQPDDQNLHGLSIGILHVDQVGAPMPFENKLEQGKSLLLANIEGACADLGFNPKKLKPENTDTTDVVIITETDLAAFQVSRLGSGSPMEGYHAVRTLPAGRVMIVLCNSIISKRRLVKSPPSVLRHAFVEFVAQPVGPARLKKAVDACARAMKERYTKQRNHSPSGCLPIRAQESRDKTEDPMNAGHEAVSILPSPMPSIRTCTQAEVSRQRIDHVCLLLVDDNEINLKLLVMYAQKQGYDMLTARDGAQAVESYKIARNGNHRTREHVETNGKPTDGLDKTQVILMDINMPVMNGYEATRRIRLFEQQTAIKPAFIIALTGLGNASAQQEAYESGMNGFLTKPVSLKQLTKTLEAIADS